MSGTKYVAANDYTPEEMLALWTEAGAQVAATGVSYAIAGRSLTRADVPAINASIEFWERRCSVNETPAVNYVRMVRR